jgi:glucosamine--fructose-6-phosphate aminotransferase (isomerizing)
MCGIIGATGSDPVLPVLLEGLARLEYRGYDSAGVALVDGDHIWRRRRAGGTKSVAELTEAVGDAPVGLVTGIGHSRWATHGAPTEVNAHPHLDGSGRLALVHNGIIENYRELARSLPRSGEELVSDTDTEVLAHLVAMRVDIGLTLADAVRSCLRQVEGKFAIAVVHAGEPGVVVGARRGSPLICGRSDGTAYLASDIPAIHGRAREFYVVLNDQVVELGAGTVRITDLAGAEVEPVVREVTWDLEAAEKGGYPDFMLKEIHEQPAAVRDTLLGRIVGGRLALDQVRLSDDDLRQVDKVFIVACGSSFHAGMVGRLAIGHFASLPVEVEIASEFRYRDPVLDSTSLVIAVSQSGETLDTMEAVAHAKAMSKARVLAVSNVVDSSLARDADAVLYTRAGPEIGVASTKCHLAQLVAMQVIALYLAQVRGKLYPEEVEHQLEHLQRLPACVDAAVARRAEVEAVAAAVADASGFLFIGRNAGYPVALEGALKLKEISYLRAEGYPAGELKHGPIALVEPGTVVVAVATRSHLKDKVISNIAEVKARGATVVALVDEHDADDRNVVGLVDHVLALPWAGHALFQPVIDVVPLQLFAYALAKARGNDVDKPRNLAKVVTVE